MSGKIKVNNSIIAVGILVFALALAFSVWNIRRTDENMRKGIMLQAGMIAATLEENRIMSLNGDAYDINNPEYIYFKSKFAKIKKSNPYCRFVYLLGMNSEKKLFFFVDNENPGSDGYSAPGDQYPEATKDDYNIFVQKNARVVGPSTDRWGTWITAYVPIINKETGKVTAVLGMDFSADYWNLEIASQSAIPVILMLFVLILIAFIWYVVKSKNIIRDSERQHRLLFETSQEGIVVDRDFKLAYFNPMMLEITGYSAEELKSINFNDLVHPEDRNSFEKSYNKILIGNETSNRYQFRLNRKNNETRWIELSSVKLNWKNDRATLNFLNDITEQKLAALELEKLNKDLSDSKAEIEASLAIKNQLIDELSKTKENLERTNHEKDKFFTIIAHDLKSPFAGFLGLTKIFAEDFKFFSSDELHEFGIDMQESAKNLYALLENLLEWSRMKRDKIDFNPENVQLDILVKQNINIQNEIARQKEIEFVTNIPENHHVIVDIPMLNSVFRNLFSNAVKFTPRGGKIEIGVGAESENGEISIYIKDNGIGMPPEIVSRLFRIDQKVSRPGTENEPSTGLGLLLCREFIEKHGGKIWVESQEGIGSIFWFNLPGGN